MSCNCDNDEPIPAESAENESLPSALDNFVLNLYGSVTKIQTEENVVAWSLPCDLDNGLAEYPKMEGEGTACYFLRLFQDAIVGLTGDKGEKGDPGANGADGRATVAEEFVIPSAGAPLVDVVFANSAVLPDGVNIFIENAGWFSVVSRFGNTLSCQLLDPLFPEGTVVSPGALAIPVGPEGQVGPVGAKGQRGDKGPDGDPGAAGAAGADGDDANTETTQSFVQPAINGTVTVPVSAGGPVSGGSEVLLGGTGYFQIVGSSPGSLTLRNTGGITPTPTTVVADGKIVLLSGLPGPLAKEVVGIGTGTQIPVTAADWVTIGFDETDLRIDLPEAGTYRMVAHVEIRFQGIAGSDRPWWSNGLRLIEADSDPVVVLGQPSYFYAGFTGGHQDNIPTGRSWAHGALLQTIRVTGPRTVAVQFLQPVPHGYPAGYETYVVSGGCWLSWVRVNDTY